MTRGLLKPLHPHLNFIRTIDIAWNVDSGIYNPRLTHQHISRLHVRKNIRYYKKARHDEAIWELACDTLSKMPMLANLRIMFLDAWWKQAETDLLGPLMKIVGLKSFLVLLPWLEEDGGVYLKGKTPFTIIRADGRAPPWRKVVIEGEMGCGLTIKINLIFQFLDRGP